jgi:hypothetical protein
MSKHTTGGSDGPELVLTRREASKLTRLSLSSLDAALRRGDFASKKIGRRVLIDRNSLLKALGE